MKSWADIAKAKVTNDRYRDAAYETHLFLDTRCEVRWCETGRILVALEPIKKGTLLWKETPSVSLQSFPNLPSVLSCGRCYQGIGTLEQQVSNKCTRFDDSRRAQQN
jgi:hypothetical protein